MGELLLFQCTLVFKSNVSDKVYKIFLELDLNTQDENHNYKVTVVYGKRISANRLLVKGSGMSHTKAVDLYEKIKREKLKKGYVMTTETVDQEIEQVYTIDWDNFDLSELKTMLL